jgi:hypothetical protein
MEAELSTATKPADVTTRRSPRMTTTPNSATSTGPLEPSRRSMGTAGLGTLAHSPIFPRRSASGFTVGTPAVSASRLPGHAGGRSGWLADPAASRLMTDV